nr:hypothetical protein [Tanacetum cinerariifolium]
KRTDQPSHPAKKLRDDYEATGGPTVGGKSQSSIQRLLTGAVQNAEVRGGVIPTLPFVSSSVSTTPEREGEDHTDLLARTNLCAIGVPQRFVISSDSSDHSGVNIAKAEVDYVVRTLMPIITIATTTTPTADTAAVAKEKLTGSSVFGADSPFAGRSHPILGGFSDCFGSDFLIGGIRTVIDPDSNLHKVYLFTEFNVGAARQMSLSAEVRIRAEYKIKERRRLNSVAVHLRAEAFKFEIVEKSLRDETQVLKERNATLEKEKSELEIQVTDLAASVKVKEQKVKDLDAVITSMKLQNDSLADHEKVTVYENCMSQLEKFQDEKMEEVNEKFDKLCADFVEMTLQLEEKFYPHLLTTISGRQWLLTHSIELAITKCLNSTEYPCALGTAIGKAIEKGMHEGLSAGITHGAEGRKLTDVAAYNPSADVDYLFAFVETIMSLLRPEDTLAERLGLVESQPHVDQVMVPIHHSPDQRVIGASALSLSLDVFGSWVRKIKENIANHVSALRGIFVPLSEPLSAMALEGTKCTSGAAPDTTTALSVTFVSASTIPPISTDDYEFAHTDGQEGTRAGVETVADESVVHFPHVSDTELDILE